ncbi:MAG: glycogen/starch/alpha-glucan phosphorylase [Opitutales bacterium]
MKKISKKTETIKDNNEIPESEFYAKVDAETLKKSMLWHLERSIARSVHDASEKDWWFATAYALRDLLMGRFIETMKLQHDNDPKRVYYLSLEYLVGRLTRDTLTNLGVKDALKDAMADLGISYDNIIASEVDMGLGNGGLGRLAACFLDSLATLDLPAVGYGIKYEFGLFRQSFEDGKQVESPDNWLQYGSPWEFMRPEYATKIFLGGHVEECVNDKGDKVYKWHHTREILGMPWDLPIVGYGTRTVNFLRLWESKATSEFDLESFNAGGYTDAVTQKAQSETISKVLYPNDKTENGKMLRLIQQYFFVSCSLQDIIRRFKVANGTNWDLLPEKAVIQLNDTHPAIAVPELIRLLVDIEGLTWEYATSLTQKIFAYTNHTLLPEALEKWSVSLFEALLPRHLQIIYEINRIWLEEVEAKFPNNDNLKSRVSIIEEGSERMVRMAYLAVVGSFSVNGVAEIHSRLLTENLLRDFFELSPEKFNNKTNGITPRRWLKTSNKGLSALIDEAIQDKTWPANLDLLRGLEAHADDAVFQEKFMAVKRENKVRLAKIVKELCDVEISPDALFDVQIKRLHEYKRQHLNLLHILRLYRALLHNPDMDITPRVFIFGAKAAPGYDIAKNIIYAINKISQAINNDERIKGKLKVVFIPNYSVTLAMNIIPAADISEQISTAGKEASGTGNMKMALNGALTLGTLDGANIEILEEVGDDNIFIFGKTVEEVQTLKANGYNPYDYYNSSEELRAVLDWLVSGYFNPADKHAFDLTRQSILDWGDPFLVCADFEAYCKAQEEVGKTYKDKAKWAKMAILNTARCAKFSSDRTIMDYANDIWNIKRL